MQPVQYPPEARPPVPAPMPEPAIPPEYAPTITGPAISPDSLRLPLTGPTGTDRLRVQLDGDRITLSAREAPLDTVLTLLAQQHGLSIVGTGTTGQTVSLNLFDVPLEQALNAILNVNGFRWHRDGRILMVTPLAAESTVSASVQGRVLQVIPLNYVSAADVDRVVKTLLSPVGKSSIMESLSTDKRKTRDQIVVEDLPENLARIESYIAQTDRPPKQVLIEARILKVDLEDETRHGVNFNYLAELAGTDISVRTVGFANQLANPSLLLGIDGGELDSLIECLKQTTSAKTLASPKVLAVNGQDARIQIGEQLGYFVTTTTQTSTLQNVEFLDVGVVLTVTPVIGEDGQILMTVKPEVSNGRVNQTTGLPEEETAEVETTVLLGDGQGMIIGGLIQEQDTDTQSKIPVLGELWAVGKLFRRSTVVRQRSEIIIALIPRIVPDPSCRTPQDDVDLTRVHMPLFTGPLQRVDRRAFEPELPDAMRNPRCLAPGRLHHSVCNLADDRPLPPEHYFPAANESMISPASHTAISPASHTARVPSANGRCIDESWAVPSAQPHITRQQYRTGTRQHPNTAKPRQYNHPFP